MIESTSLLPPPFDSVHVKILIILVFVGYFSYMYFQSSTKLVRHYHNGKWSVFQYPPIAPHGYLATLRALSGTRGPQFFLQNIRAVGDIHRINLSTPRGKPIVIADPELQRTIFLDKESTKPDSYKIIRLVMECPDILTGEGLAWRHARKGIAPAFSSQHISRMTDVVSEMMQEWIETRLESFAESGESFDVCKEMLNLTLRIITKSAFNYEISQEEIDQYLHDSPFITKERIKWRIPFRRRMSMFIPAVREANECAKRLVSLSSKILQAYKESDTTLPGSCIDLIINNPNYKNDIHRCCDINVLIGAGHETSAYSVAWTLLELARNPSIQSDLNRVLKKESEQSGGQGDYSNVKELQNVVAESMRLNPVIGTGSVRVLARDIVVESKIEGEPDMLIPKGSSAFLTPYGRNRNANYYDQPDVFLPERWNDISIKNALKELMPFAVGRRDCVGQSLANAEIMTVLPKLLLDYNFTVVDEGRVENFVTMKPLGARLVAKKIS